MRMLLPRMFVASAALAVISAASAEDPYIERARAYADAMLAHGRDTYGAQHGPAFACTIDLRTLEMPQETSEATTRLHADFFRADDYATSANPMYHVDLYQLLFALSAFTGDPVYQEAGEAAIAWFFRNAQSPETGLLAWGEHMGWDLVTDTYTVGGIRQDGKFHVSDTHEFYAPWLHWDVTWKVAPGPARKFARGLWDHQIANHDTGAFSRHARYSQHGPGEGYEFARQLGFYLDTWAAGYAHSGEEILLQAIQRMTAAAAGWRSPGSRLIPFEGKSPQVAFVLHNLAFIVDGWRAAQRLPEPEKSALEQLIRELDDAVLGLQYDLAPEGRGFPKIVDSATGAVSHAAMRDARPQYTPEQIDRRYWPWGGLWASEYGAGSYTDARHALLCFYRWKQTQREDYRRRALETADRYLERSPGDAEQALTPKTLAPVMALLHGAFRMSGDAKYLDKSTELAGIALHALFQEGVALPYATQHKEQYPYYAAISYGDSLLLTFFELGLLRSGRVDLVERLDLGCSIR